MDPRLGSPADIRAIGDTLEPIVDVIVNHVSSDAEQFRDFLTRGAESAHADMFLALSSVFPAGATEADLLAIYRPRQGMPFTPYTLAGKERRLVWTTFTSRQIDLDVRAPETHCYLTGVLRRLADAGVRMIRLDAVGYAIKTPGTSCFMTPETFAFIDELTVQARGLGMEVLVEVHSHFQKQIAIGQRVDRVYDFALPPLILYALLFGDGTALARWLEIHPRNAVTVLDAHDGIGVIDVGADSADRSLAGLLGPEQVDQLVERIHDNSGGTSRRATGAAASNVDLYQINCTYHDALGADDRRYLLARSGVGRDVNRHYYSAEELAAALQRPVVRALQEAIRFRNTHPAFSRDLRRVRGRTRRAHARLAGRR